MEKKNVLKGKSPALKSISENDEQNLHIKT